MQSSYATKNFSYHPTNISIYRINTPNRSEPIALTVIILSYKLVYEADNCKFPQVVRPSTVSLANFFIEWRTPLDGHASKKKYNHAKASPRHSVSPQKRVSLIMKHVSMIFPIALPFGYDKRP